MATALTLSKLRSALALGLMLWCAGTGCLAHGMAMGGAASTPNNKSAKTNISQSEMTMSGHACCKARHRLLESRAKSNSDSATEAITLPEDSSSDDAASCCPLTSGSFVTSSRTQTDENNSSASTGTGFIEPGSTVQFPATRAIPLRPPNHEQTYLTCCALLI